MQVTVNLESALRRLREKFHLSTHFWIDAVCINQEDDEEKTQQVSQMRDIFADAEFVMMWVGEEDELTAFQFSMIEIWANYGVRVPESSQLLEHEREPLLEVTEAIEDEGVNEEDVEALLLRTPEVPARMEKFFRRPYFTRSWIVQEVVVSRDAMLVCGSFWIPFDRFIDACYAMGVHSPYRRLRGRGMMLEIINMELWQRRLRAEPDRSSDLDLLYFLSIERDQEATDPRDKVFAFLGIADQTGGLPVAVDYTKSVEEVYTAAARYMLEASDPLEVLSTVQGKWSELSMPSWVPDWSQRWRGCGSLNARWTPTPFRAAGNTKAILVPCQDQNAICLQGFRLDVVRQSGGSRLCNKRTEHGSPFITEDSLRADIKILGLEDRIQYDLTREKYVDAYLRTITCNLSAFSSRLDDQSHALERPAFYAWIRAGRPGVGPPEQVWHEVSYDAAVIMRATDLFISEKGLLGLGPKDTNA
ncbi:hypothetical protein L207DRAFT_520774 [Hyaloscypha variabilis F]|uniref:Heterokaryon incompatibility domain-containing protein n=1 Tax=Hyaloscypha variabilis (strain UAMH 11265 / GT02V1 / F) TaxID=1149755 RepID=A0A2J6QTU1_HYAVF|nr:hypothetical protein L207DRAFT_520774 [Hyaloscypha variabilis F]